MLGHSPNSSRDNFPLLLILCVDTRCDIIFLLTISSYRICLNGTTAPSLKSRRDVQLYALKPAPEACFLLMATRAAIEDFGTEELCDFLSTSGDISEDGINNFRTNRISGSTVFTLDAADLKELLPVLGDRKIVQKLISSYQPSEPVSPYMYIIAKPFPHAASTSSSSPGSAKYRIIILGHILYS